MSRRAICPALAALLIPILFSSCATTQSADTPAKSTITGQEKKLKPWPANERYMPTSVDGKPLLRLVMGSMGQRRIEPGQRKIEVEVVYLPPGNNSIWFRHRNPVVATIKPGRNYTVNGRMEGLSTAYIWIEDQATGEKASQVVKVKLEAGLPYGPPMIYIPT